MVMNPLDPLRRDAERIVRSLGDRIEGFKQEGNPGNEIKVKRYQGQIIEVGHAQVKVPALPDWDLVYIEYPEGEMPKYRNALMRERVKIIKVTRERIYFE